MNPHLAHSNIAAEFVPTGFKKNRSHFLKQIAQEEKHLYDNVIENVEYGQEGRCYIEKSSMLDKYERLPKQLKLKLSYSQFVKRYTPCKEPENYDFDKDLEEKVTEDMKEKGDYLFYDHLQTESLFKLPMYIHLTGTTNPDEISWMRRRLPKAIRFHKFKQSTNPHEHYHSQMQLFLPFDTETDLLPEDASGCKEMYLQNLEKINFVKGKVLPHCKQVEDAREMAEKLIANDTGDTLDPQNEVEEAESAMEGTTQHPDYAAFNPEAMYTEDRMSVKTEKYSKIVLDTEDVLLRKIRTLDAEQRAVFHIGIKYGRDYKKAEKISARGKNPSWPTPPLLLVHGGAGTGKSHLIDILSQKLEKIFRTAGDSPTQPYILKTAFTGSAAKIINGQTIHSVFKFAFNDKIMSATHKDRDNMRTNLRNLKLLIIDEISLVKAEMLYQLHFRLSKEIFQNDLPFGGIAVIVFGDIMQIKPVKGRFVFSQTRSDDLQLIQSLNNLWHNFQVVNLKTNHRQGEDKQYADMLNRFRVGTQTPEDVDLLKTRVVLRDDESVPAEALIITGTNAVVDKHNMKKLNQLSGELVELKALVHTSNKGEFKPPLYYGTIIGTTLQYELKLKVGCKVMLVSNLDVCDGLVNGSLGSVVAFVYNKSNIKYIMVKFDDIDDGKNRRKNFSFEDKYPGATPIELMEVTFSLSKDKGGASSCGTAVNFPLRLCYSTTAHKKQGSTVKKPNCLVLDLKCRLQRAMVYVMLSRIQSLNQLYILEELPVDQIKPFDDALKELERLDAIDITLNKPSFYLTIVSQNTRSLGKHFQDLQADQGLTACDLICIQETWFEDQSEQNDNYSLEGKTNVFANAGRGKGVAIYFPEEFQPIQRRVMEAQFQIVGVKSDKMAIFNVYRSKPAKHEEIVRDLQDMIEKEGHNNEVVLVLGDFNFCERDEKEHPVRRMLLAKGFSSLLDPPVSSHIEGNCLDQVYIKKGEVCTLQFKARVETSSFSDHDQLIVEVTKIDRMVVG